MRKPLAIFFYEKVIILSGLDTGRRQNSEEEAKEAIPLPRLEIPSNNRHGSYKRRQYVCLSTSVLLTINAMKIF